MNPQNQRVILLGGVISLLSLVGYALYELVLRPKVVFPSDDMGVILGGVDTLRVGHWLKFGYALGVSLLALRFWRSLRPSLLGIVWGVGLLVWGLLPVTKTTPLPSTPAH